MKRRRNDDGDVAPPQRYSRLNDEILRYFQEIDAHFSLLDDEEAKSLLVDNVLDEIRNQETEVVPDAVCSRVIEKLLPFATATALSSFVGRCLEGENLGLICTRYDIYEFVLLVSCSKYSIWRECVCFGFNPFYLLPGICNQKSWFCAPCITIWTDSLGHFRQ